MFPSRDPQRNGPSASSPSSPRPIFPNRRTVEEEAGLPEDFSEKELAHFTEQVEQEAALRAIPSHKDGSPSSLQRQQSPPPQYPTSEASASSSTFRPPPPFSSLYSTNTPLLDPEAAAATVLEPCEPYKESVEDCDNLFTAESSSSAAAPAYAPSEQVALESSSSNNTARFQDETKRALPQDTKAGRSASKEEEAEPPPAYSEGSSPLQSFTYLMAAAGGAASIITQVQQGGPPINTIGGQFESIPQ